MDAIRWWMFRCPTCKGVIAKFGFDQKGVLHLKANCPHCVEPIEVTHTVSEQQADVREAFNWWCESNDINAEDFKLWEWEVREDGDCSD